MLLTAGRITTGEYDLTLFTVPTAGQPNHGTMRSLGTQRQLLR